MKKLKLYGALIGIPLALLVTVWLLRLPLARVFPIKHTGTVMRIGQFNKGGLSRHIEGTRQLTQFAIIFDDGFQCEGTDTSFAAVKEGDLVQIRGYHDVRGLPVMDPEWWECDEAQLVRIFPASEAEAP